MKKAIIQIGNAVIGYGNTFADALSDAQIRQPLITAAVIVLAEGALPGDFVCVSVQGGRNSSRPVGNWVPGVSR